MFVSSTFKCCYPTLSFSVKAQVLINVYVSVCDLNLYILMMVW
jgi:hypothetical protein